MTTQTSPDFRDRQTLILELVAGYAGHRAVQIGLEHGILQYMAIRGNGIGAADLAAETGLDPAYLEVWCRLAHAAGVLDESADGYRLDAAVVTLLTDRESPAYLGGLFTAFGNPEIFDQFTERLPTGERTWWDQVSPEFIRAVAETTRSASVRLIPGGLAGVPGLHEVLDGECDVLDLACGTGFGLARLGHTYPSARLVGVDGDAHSLQQAAGYLSEAGVGNRVELVHDTLEGFDRQNSFDLAVINMSMHECRDIERVTDNLYNALRPGGYFVISDFPFPDTLEGLRTIPGRIMAGIQVFEAQIDDRLLPTQRYVDLLDSHGFEKVGTFDITETHAVTHGRKPGR